MYDFILSADGRNVPEDLHPPPEKMVTVSDGFLVHNVTGIRVHIVSRLDGKGYDITKRMFELTCILRHHLLTHT